MKYFNTAGPCEPGLHYMLPAVDRLSEVRRSIEYGQCCVVRAPGGTGKSTALAELARELDAAGEYLALHLSCDVAEIAGDDYGRAELLILERICDAAAAAGFPAELLPPPWPDGVPGNRLKAGLAAWAARSPKPLVLLFDEIDCVRGESLVGLLRQLRDGYTTHRRGFAHSIVLCGVRDVRDVRVDSGPDPDRRAIANWFNIVADSVRMRDFTRDEVARLYAQHTAATGQEFTELAVEAAYRFSGGQPWLVNALANEVIVKMGVSGAIAEEDIYVAKERLIRTRGGHLDSLVGTLHDPRMRTVVEPLLAGGLVGGPDYSESAAYARDLGLIATDNPVRTANPIYNEVIVRALAASAEENVTADPACFRLVDGQVDFPRLLTEFAAFWKEHGERIEVKLDYHAVAPQLVFLAFLQRIVGGDGFVDREYGIGRGRIDLQVRRPYLEGGRRAVQREALELKVWTDDSGDPLETGAAQLDNYLDRLELSTGVLIIFDRRSTARSVTERTRFSDALTPSGRVVTLLRA